MDAILILGAAVWPDGPSPTLRRRALHGAALWHAGVAPVVIGCGGLGRHPPTEAAMIASLLLDAGVHATAILQEGRSTTTIENIRFALPLLRSIGATRVVIVTDATHGPRAARVARHYRLRARVSATALRGSHPPTVMRQAVRELFAYPLYAARLWRMPRDD
ncbi:DUF218 domain-containing protein [Loktanella fryxellensis]|uniref:DUF218 domain-containing protein n=1 Tax=Loktanella fryxellensis TaxID=245187 RepID=A0A1H8AJU0_9RHOB|nr:YdcF family protein [Loktanella fryxellensis]SEM70069.1 DUF218 domain-containing protein [Loktanella fryxellensis]